MTELFENERIDDLQINGLKLIQNARLYCFTSDAVLLANHVAVKKSDRVLDIGTGSGIIAILLAGKKNAGNVVAVEIQQTLANIAERNVKMNNLDDKVAVVYDSIQSFAKTNTAESFDVVVSNPPYKRPTAGEMDKNESRAICKYELQLSLAELAESASRLLKFGGKFYMVHRADRLAECVYVLKQNKLEPKVLTLIYPKADKTPDTVIFECLKGGAEGVKIKSLIVFDENNSYTEAAKKLYCKE